MLTNRLPAAPSHLGGHIDALRATGQPDTPAGRPNVIAFAGRECVGRDVLPRATVELIAFNEVLESRNDKLKNALYRGTPNPDAVARVGELTARCLAHAQQAAQLLRLPVEVVNRWVLEGLSSNAFVARQEHAGQRCPLTVLSSRNARILRQYALLLQMCRDEDAALAQ